MKTYKEELLDKYLEDVSKECGYKRTIEGNKQLNISMGYTKVHQNKDMVYLLYPKDVNITGLFTDEEIVDNIYVGDIMEVNPREPF